MALQFQDKLQEAWRLLQAAPQPSGNHAEEVLQKNYIFVTAMAARFLELRRSLLSAMPRVQEGCQEAQKKEKKAQETREAAVENSLCSSAWHIISVWIPKLNHFSYCTVRIWGGIRL